MSNALNALARDARDEYFDESRRVFSTITAITSRPAFLDVFLTFLFSPILRWVI
jgi:hypothetical protein